MLRNALINENVTYEWEPTQLLNDAVSVTKLKEVAIITLRDSILNYDLLMLSIGTNDAGGYNVLDVVISTLYPKYIVFRNDLNSDNQYYDGSDLKLYEFNTIIESNNRNRFRYAQGGFRDPYTFVLWKDFHKSSNLIQSGSIILTNVIGYKLTKKKNINN